jgi:hypothetical protein
MTEPSDFEADEQLLPGLEPPARGESPLQLATRRTIAGLNRAGLLDERHAMVTQLLLDLAEVHDVGRRHGKASAAAMAAAQMLAGYQLLMPEAPSGGDDNDEWTRLANELRQAHQDVVAELGRSGPTVRDST